MCDVTQVLRTSRFCVLEKFFFNSKTMSLASGTVNNPVIDSLIQTSLESEDDGFRLKWIPCSDITEIKPTLTDTIFYAGRKQPDGKVKETMIALLGSREE